MKNLGWRLFTVLFAFAVMTGGAARAQSAVAAPGMPETKVLSQAEVFPFDQMTVKRNPNGGESRNIVQGALKTGEGVALHESMLPVGMSPNPGHTIQHSEFIVVREGTLEFEHDGKSERVGPGGVIYVAFGTMHKIVNVGNVPAAYVVIAIGGDTKK
jgi:mannose-6-phosphate isomerase-like protein (cupin superfamily)